MSAVASMAAEKRRKISFLGPSYGCFKSRAGRAVNLGQVRKHDKLQPTGVASLQGGVAAPQVKVNNWLSLTASFQYFVIVICI